MALSPCRLKTIDSWKVGCSLLDFGMLLPETETQNRAPAFRAAVLELQGPVERGRSLRRLVSGALYIFTGTTVKWYVTSRTKPTGGFSA
jgi:hypothetical protein